MKKTVKKSLAVLIALITLFSVCSCIVCAEETPETRSLYYNTVESTASISTNGLLTIRNRYTIKPNSGFTSAKISTYVERKVLGLFWVKVDNGQPNKTWVATPTATDYSKTYTLQLTQTGNYRVTAEYIFYGSSGSETVTKQPTATY